MRCSFQSDEPGAAGNSSELRSAELLLATGNSIAPASAAPNGAGDRNWVHGCSYSCSIAYHARRSAEESERALALNDPSARMAHEALAHLHLQAAARLQKGLGRIVAQFVD